MQICAQLGRKKKRNGGCVGVRRSIGRLTRFFSADPFLGEEEVNAYTKVLLLDWSVHVTIHTIYLYLDTSL
jgi:hypothetical protein